MGEDAMSNWWGKGFAKEVKGSIDPDAVNVRGAGAIAPAQLASSGTEHGHQVAVMQWVALVGMKKWPSLWLLHAIPNGGDRKQSVAASLKAEGVKSGVPDLCLPVPIEGLHQWHHGLYIEMKRPGLEGTKNGGRSDKQVEWQKRLREQGYAVVTAYGWQAACWALKLYLEGQVVMPSEHGGDDCLFALPVVDPPDLG